MRIYVAGSSAERERVRAAMDAVRAMPDAELAHDWLAVMEAVGKPDSELTDDECREHVDEDLAHVRNSDVLWFLIPGVPSKGAWCELKEAAGRDDVICVRSGNPDPAMSGPFGRALSSYLGTDEQAAARIARRDWP